MRPRLRRDALAVLAACVLHLAGAVPLKAGPADPAAVVRELFVRYAAGDVRGASALWVAGAPADDFVRRHRARLEKRCMRLESLAIEPVSSDPPTFDATSTLILRSAQEPAEWWETAHSRIALQRDGAEWRISAWEPRERELIDRFVASSPDERPFVLASSRQSQTTTFVRLAAQRGVDLSNKGRLDDAAAITAEAIAVAGRLGEPAAMSVALSASSIVHRLREDVDRSLGEAEEALALADGAGDPDVLARALVRLTRTREHLAGAPAPELVARALALSDSLEEVSIAAHAAIHLGRSYELRGHFREAFRLAEQASRLADESGDLAARTSAAMFLHGAFLWVDAHLAKRYSQRILDLSREAGFDVTTAAGQINVSIWSMREGDVDGALRVVNDELRRTSLPAAVVPLLRMRARIYVHLNRFEDALRDLEQSRALAPLDASSRQETEWDLAILEVRRGDYEAALAHAHAARGANATWNNGGRHQQADILLRLGRVDEARAMLDELLTDINLALLSPQHSLFYSIRDPVRSLLVEILVAQGDLDGALRTAEEMKSKGLAAALSHGKNTAAGPRQEHPRERVLEARIAELNRRLAGETLSGAAAAAVREQLSTARIDLLDLRQRLHVGRPAMPIERSAAVCIDELPAHLDDVTIVSYVVGEERTIVFALGPKRDGRRKVTARSIEINLEDLRARVRELATLVEQRNLRAAGVAARMYDLLIGPIESEVRGARSLCIVPDYALWHVPFQALGPDGGPPLVERTAVFYAPSIAVLAAAHGDGKAGPRAAKPRLLAFANPAVGTETASLYRAFDPDAPLGAIPETETEVRAIARIYGDDASRVYVGKTARETTLKQEASRFDVLHIATHGVVYDKTPMFSSLLLTASPDDENDGVLEAREIANLALNADLAVLSACETGRANVDGNGVIGLSWAFLAAGCPTTIVSQWKAHSAAAATLMVELHRQLARGRSKPEALRLAQLALRRDRRYRHPFYWAPFMVIGSPR